MGGLKHIPCPVCSRKLKGAIALKQHIHKYHGDIDYKCPICGKESRRGKLIMHYAHSKDHQHQLLYLIKKRSGAYMKSVKLIKTITIPHKQHVRDGK